MTSKENNKGVKTIIDVAVLAVFCAAVIVGGVLLVSSIRSKSVDLKKYVSVTYSGANGQGEAVYTFDEEKFEADWEEKLAVSYKKLLEEAKAEEAKCQKQVEKYEKKHPGVTVPASVANPLKDAQELVKTYEDLLANKECAKTFAEKYLNLSLTTEALKEAKEEELAEEEDATRETEIGEDTELTEEEITEVTEAETTESAEEEKEEEKTEAAADESEEAAEGESSAEAAEGEETSSPSYIKGKTNVAAVETAPNTKLTGLSNGDKLLLEMRGEWIAKKHSYQCDEDAREVTKTIKSIFGLWINFNSKYTVSGLQ